MTTICLFWEITPWHTRKHSSNSKKKKMIPTINSALCATYRHTHTLSSTSSLHPSESIHTKTQTRHLVVVFFFFLFMFISVFCQAAQQYTGIAIVLKTWHSKCCGVIYYNFKWGRTTGDFAAFIIKLLHEWLRALLILKHSSCWSKTHSERQTIKVGIGANGVNLPLTHRVRRFLFF